MSLACHMRETNMMAVILAKNWWSLLIRGLAAITLGVIAVAWHGITVGQLAMLFGAYAVFDGLVAFAGAVRAAEVHQRWLTLLIEGIAGIIAGIAALGWAAITLISLEEVIAGWALLTGVLEIAAAVRLRAYLPGEWLLALGGAASLILGVLTIALPLAGTLEISRWIGIYAFVFGALLIGLGLRLRACVIPSEEQESRSPDLTHWQRPEAHP